MRRAALLAALALIACDRRGEEPEALPVPVASARGDEETPYGAGPDGSRFRHVQLAKLKALELVVGDADPEDELPIVVMLHGLADKPRLPPPGTNHPRAPVRVFLPRGPYLFEQGFAWYPHRMSEGKYEAMRIALEGTAHHLALFLAAIEDRHASPCRPVVVGFSQGAMATLAAAVTRPEAMSEAIVGAGWLPPGLEPGRAPAEAVPIRMMHGLADRIVPAEPTIEVAEALARRGFPVELELFEGVAHAMSAEMNRTLTAWIDAALERCPSPAGSANPRPLRTAGGEP